MSAPAPVAGIVIGTSAGGVEALSQLLPALPPTLAAAVFVVIHLPRERPSLLTEIFAPKCQLPVMEAVDKEPVQPGTIYFAPPDYHLLIDRGQDGLQLALSADGLINFSRPSIDVLFESAADAYGAALMAIVLTGGSQDGAAGLAAVHRAGGRCLVQSPASAQSPYMSEAALLLTPSATVLGLPGIAETLRTLQTGDAS
jgi:two-component system chemotaxis response regulator CheB